MYFPSPFKSRNVLCFVKMHLMTTRLLKRSHLGTVYKNRYSLKRNTSTDNRKYQNAKLFHFRLELCNVQIPFKSDLPNQRTTFNYSFLIMQKYCTSLNDNVHFLLLMYLLWSALLTETAFFFFFWQKHPVFRYERNLGLHFLNNIIVSKLFSYLCASDPKHSAPWNHRKT